MPNRKSKSSSNKYSSMRNSRRRLRRSGSSVSNVLQCHKEFQIVPPPTGTKLSNPDWFRYLKYFAVIAAKLILYATTFAVGITTYPLALAQVIYLGPEDLLIRHRLCYQDSGTTRKIFPFEQGRILSVTAVLTPTVQLSHRAGRILLSILPVTEDEADGLATDSPQPKLPTDLIGPLNSDQRFRCANGPATRPLRYTWKPSGYNASFFSMGGTAPGDKGKPPRGGRFIFKILYSFQNFSSDGKIATSFSTDSAVFNLSVTARIQVRGVNPISLREVPLYIATESASVVSDHAQIDVPVKFIGEDGMLEAGFDSALLPGIENLHMDT